MYHLNDKQKQRIFDLTVELLHEDVKHDQNCLDRIIRKYVESKDIENQLTIISSDEDCQASLLGFDPSTGEVSYGI